MTQNATTVDFSIEFEKEIADIEQSISALKQRQADIQLAQRERVVLERQRNQLKHSGSKHPDVKQELAQIQSRLDRLDFMTESQLLKKWGFLWVSLLLNKSEPLWVEILLNRWEPFWQAVRFGGLGIALGWFISTWGK